MVPLNTDTLNSLSFSFIESMLADVVILSGVATITNLTYADDTTLIDTPHSNAQEKLNILAKLCKELCLEINTMKTKIAGISFTSNIQSPTSV